jgi:hypothetical protein
MAGPDVTEVARGRSPIFGVVDGFEVRNEEVELFRIGEKREPEGG